MTSRWRTETIGDATLICGDAREVLPAIRAADMVMMDPPYGHNNNNGDLIHRREAALGRPPSDGDTSVGRPIANDGPEANELLRAILPELRRILPPGGCCCCCCGGGPDPQFARWSLWLDEVLNFKQMVVWDKGPMGMGWHYRRSYETVLVAEKPGAACRWFDKTSAVENIIRPGSLPVNKIIPGAEHHPTEKPLGLKAHFIRLHTEPGHTVLDPFMGSGSTGAAAISLGRKFIGIEIDEVFFDGCVRRLERLQDAPLFDEPRAKPTQELLDL